MAHVITDSHSNGKENVNDSNGKSTGKDSGK